MRPGRAAFLRTKFSKLPPSPFVNVVVGTTISADLVVLNPFERGALVHMAVSHDLVDIAHPVPAESGAVLVIANASILPIAPVHAATSESAPWFVSRAACQQSAGVPPDPERRKPAVRW
jgi:hypothetical protein